MKYKDYYLSLFDNAMASIEELMDEELFQQKEEYELELALGVLERSRQRVLDL